MSDTTGVVSSVFGASDATGVGVVSDFASIVSVTVFCTASPVRVVSTDHAGTGASLAGDDSREGGGTIDSVAIRVFSSATIGDSSFGISASISTSSVSADLSSFSRSSRTWSA